jgi:hypothetical protein
MPKAKHFKAATFVHNQLFAELASFAQLESASLRCRMKKLGAMPLKFSPKLAFATGY